MSILNLKIGYQMMYESEFGDYQYRRQGNLVYISNQKIVLIGNFVTKQLVSFKTYRIYPFTYYYENLHIKIHATTKLKYRGPYVKCKFAEFGCDEKIVIKTSSDQQWFDFNKYYEFNKDIYIFVNWFTVLFMDLLGKRFQNAEQVAQSIWQRFQTHLI